MATTVPTTQPDSSSTAPLLQNVYLLPGLLPQQQRGRMFPTTIRPVPGVKCLSIALLVLSTVITVLGCVAAGIMARHSYLGDPIWTGVLFILPTGILGTFVNQKRNFCLNISFFVMTVVSSAATFQLFCYCLDAALSEFFVCDPSPLDQSPSWQSSQIYIPGCTARWSRILVDVLIILCSLAALALCIISFSMTLYGTFTCCYTCCDDNQSSPVGANTAYGNQGNFSNSAQRGWPSINQSGPQPFLVAPSQQLPPNALPSTRYVPSQPPQQFATNTQQLGPATNVYSTQPHHFVPTSYRQVSQGGDLLVTSTPHVNTFGEGDVSIQQSGPPASIEVEHNAGHRVTNTLNTTPDRS